jgi:Na+-translocating ferredoxin:NAD+ oxidoreductase RnfD subunit
VTSRTLTFGGTSYPLILPSVRDPRLHVAAVILTIHLLGQTVLGFELTVPQILAAILTCAVLEVAITFRQTRSFVWPASAMLTGSGVALIMRVVGTPAHDPWNTFGWYIFAAVAAVSLLTKYLIKYRGSHVFNPSNIGLVLAFVILGSALVEPLDFWWGPLDVWMLLAYAIIIVGGLLITARLHLLALAGTYWITLAAGLGLLAASGHCMTAQWAFAPVCGVDYWRVIVASPEVMIFLFFMITDPKTIPAGQVGRVVFGVLVAVTSVFLMAPQTDEFGTKVGLLASLVLVCAARPILDRFLPEARTAADDVSQFTKRLATGGAGTPTARRAMRAGLAGVAVLALGIGIVAAGSPARGTIVADASEVLDRLPSAVDPSTFPPITVEQDVADWNHEIAGAGAQELMLMLAENLELERQAILGADASILAAVDHGDRLVEMQNRVAEAAATGKVVIEHYRFDSVNVALIEPFGVQSGLSLGVEASGTVTTETYDAEGKLQRSEESPYELTFVLRRATGDRWLNVGVLAGT